MKHLDYPYPYTEPCPYCARPDLLAPKKRPRRGGEWFPMRDIGRLWPSRSDGEDSNVEGATLHKFSDHLRVFLPSEKFAGRFQPFTVEMLGFRFNFTPGGPIYSVPPPPALLTSTRHQLITGTHERAAEAWCEVFAGSVVAHPSGLVLAVHWWPSHGRIMQLTGKLPEGMEANEAIEVAQKSLEIFTEETRGAPKINRGRLLWALRMKGPRATQSGVADLLGAGETTIRDFLRRENLKWPHLKQMVHGNKAMRGKNKPAENT